MLGGLFPFFFCFFLFFGQVKAALPFKTEFSLWKKEIHFSLGNLLHCLKCLRCGKRYVNGNILFIYLTDIY